MDRTWQIITLVSSGKVQTQPKSEVTFVIPSIAARDLTWRCGLSEIAGTQKAVMARVQVLKRIREIEKAVEIARNTVGQRVRTLYPLVKSPDPNQWSQVTLAEAVRLVEPNLEPSLITTFAVHKNLMYRNTEFVSEFLCYRTSQTFDVRPQSHVDTIDAITAMSRIPNGPLAAFSERVRRATISNRKIFVESWAEPPSYYRGDKPVFSPDDEVIINFLIHSLDRKTSAQLDPYRLGLSSILKQVEAYKGLVDAPLIHRVLIDMGVFPPWQDLIARLRVYDLYQGPPESSPKAIEQEALVKKAFSMQKASQKITDLSPEEFYPHDPAESIRHDFGDMPVYVIDDTGAEELDDGISVETNPSEPGSAWIHAHIADPTAILPPTHTIAQHARAQSETAYFLHRTWPMLPRSLVHGPLSLSSSEAGSVYRVLTFSFKVDPEGSITDYQVRPALVRNLHRLDYDSVDLAMGIPPPRKEYPFGVPDIPRQPTMHVKQTFLDDLDALHKVANRLVAARLKLPTFSQSAPHVIIGVAPRPLVSPSFDIMKPTYYRGFPRITYALSSLKYLEVGSRKIVSEVMKATSRVASRFCLDHNVPVLRRASGRILTKTEGEFEELLAKRDSDGYVDWMEIMLKDAVTPPAEYTLEPKMHWGLGVPKGEGYVRVTSPLRRYDDMVAHWQIKHALLGLEDKPPFSVELLAESGRNRTLMQAHRKQAMNHHEKFWALAFIQRWMEERTRKGESIDPLADLVGISVTTPSWDRRNNEYYCLVRLPKLGVNGILEGLGMLSDIPLGTEIPVKITAVKFGLMSQLMLVRR